MGDIAPTEGSPLRIGLIAPVADAVRPTSGRSIEKIVSLLADGLVERGHDVTLFATGDSITRARLAARYGSGYEQDASLWDWTFHETLHCAAAFARAAEFDVLHSHDYHFALPFEMFTDVPVVHTCHVILDDDVIDAFATSGANVSAISSYQAATMARASPVAIVHNGVELAAFPGPCPPAGYLLFLGMLSYRKGVMDAVVIARRAGRPLVLAGPWGDARGEIEPLLDGTHLRYVGGVDVPTRNRLLADADAILYPIQEPETFGLVLVEAMACGTPQIARSLGAVPEIVGDGVTGFHRESLDEMVECVAAVAALDRTAIRDSASRFSHELMIERYVDLYRELVVRSAAGS